ncbi:MAG: choice-of-anchor D domain-containing protein [Calditrichaeota bacterium]|nr:choice-of-anchor D domain-containing protein [Calditrichota bacterium]
MNTPNDNPLNNFPWYILLCLIALFPPITPQVLAQSPYVLHAAHVTQIGSGWTDRNAAEGAPDNCNDSNNYAKNFVDGSTTYLYNDQWSSFTPTANEVLTGLYLNFNGRPNNGYNGAAIRAGYQEESGSYNQRDYDIDQNDEVCRWIIEANGGDGRDILAARSAWTVNSIQTLSVRLRKLMSGWMRINSMKLTVITATVTQSTTALNFGTIQVGQSSSLSIVLTRTGSGTICGTWGSTCGSSPFGGSATGSYCLSPEQSSQTFSVIFSPTAAGSFSCVLDTGLRDLWGNPRTVSITGTAVQPSGAVAPAALSFATTQIGQTSASNSYTITNTGVGPLSGTVTSSSPSTFSITSGGGAYSINPGQTRQVTLNFTPTSEGLRTANIANGSACPAVSVSGSGVSPSGATIPSALMFADTQTGEVSPSLFYTISNTGVGPLSGTVSSSSPSTFSVIGGGGSYILNPGQTRQVLLHFSPSIAGLQTAGISNGPDCPAVSVQGTGLEGICSVSTSQLDFGGLLQGEFADSTFAITNVGNGVLSVNELLLNNDGSFIVMTEGGYFDLNPGQTRMVTVRFHPALPGPHSCQIQLGNSCGVVECFGLADWNACTPSATRLEFCARDSEDQVIQTLTILNPGIESIECNIWIDGYVFYLLSGGGIVTIDPGEEHTVSIAYVPYVFQPDGGLTQIGHLETGCSEVELLGYDDQASQLTGNVSVDFSDYPGVEDLINDVALPPSAPAGTISGWDIAGVYFHLDRCERTLSVGIDFRGLAGDADGDSLEGNTADWLEALGGMDFSNLAETESICMAIDFNMDYYPDIIAGHDNLGNGFRVCSFVGDPDSLPNGFGTPLPAHNGGFLAPPLSGPDYEFKITNVNDVIDFSAREYLWMFWIYSGSLQDGDIGQDSFTDIVDYIGGSGHLDCDPPEEIIISATVTAGRIAIDIDSGQTGSNYFLNVYSYDPRIVLRDQILQNAQLVKRINHSSQIDRVYVPILPETRARAFFVVSEQPCSEDD